VSAFGTKNNSGILCCYCFEAQPIKLVMYIFGVGPDSFTLIGVVFICIVFICIFYPAKCITIQTFRSIKYLNKILRLISSWLLTKSLLIFLTMKGGMINSSSVIKATLKRV
jgi:hypothetical protein